MVTRKDVARAAGVSPATVSYALAPDGPVSEATRHRVLEAARELGYTPNAMAATLAGARSKVIAMVTSTLAHDVNDADLEYLVGATAAARALDHQVLLWTLAPHEAHELPRLGAGVLVSGVLLMEVRLSDERVDFLQRSGIPFALVGRTADPSGLLFADRDFDRVGELAVAHLAELGHRRIAYLGPPQSPNQSGIAAVHRAEAGVLDAADRAGIQVVNLPCALEVEAGRRAYTRLRRRSPAITGVISFNEEATFGLYQAIHAAGLRIPEDMSVLSISVPARHAAFFDPPLTTISPPGPAIGAAATRALIHRLSGSEPDPDSPGGEPGIAGQSLWAGDLVLRASTGRAPETGRRGSGRARGARGET